MFCTKCGHRNPDGGNFCASCGTTLHPAEEQTMAITLEDEPSLESLRVGQGLLVIKGGPTAGSTVLIDADITVTGRNPHSDVFLDDVTVSRRHAEITRENGRFWIKDAGSLNGTYVNRERIDEVVLAGGDEVQIGKYRLVYFASSPTGATTGAAWRDAPETPR